MNYRVIYPQDQILIHSPKIVKLLYILCIRVYTLYFLFIGVFVDLRCNDIIIGFH